MEELLEHVVCFEYRVVFSGPTRGFEAVTAAGDAGRGEPIDFDVCTAVWRHMHDDVEGGSCSFARHAGQQPTYYNAIRGQHGDRYADLTQEPQFAFGEGLSYSSVTYSNLRLDASVVSRSDDIHATVTVTNTGRRPVIETVQAYIRDVVTSVTWAEHELKAFRQVQLQPNDTADIDIVIPVTACTLVNAAGVPTVEPGEFELLVGPNSRRDNLLVGRFTVVV